MFIKIYYENQIHKISKIPEAYKAFTEKIQEIIRREVTLPTYTIQYEDDEGDRVMLSSEEDYKTMLSTETEADHNTIKIYITPRRLSVTDLPLKKSGTTRSHSDKGSAQISFYSSDDERKDLSDREEEKVSNPRAKAEANAKAAAQRQSSPKKPFYCGITLNKTKSQGGDIFELPKSTFVVVTKFFNTKGLAEVVSKGLCGLFPIKDLQIVNKERNINKLINIPKFESNIYRKAQYSY
jgi:hypothetical protein